MTDNKPYPDLPKPVASSGYFPVYSSHQMRAYVDADRAMRAAQPENAAVAGPSAPVSPMAKMALALREKSAAERNDFDRRVQSGEWGAMPEPSTEADALPNHVAEVKGDDAIRILRWSNRVGAFDYPVGTKLYATPTQPAAPPAVSQGTMNGVKTVHELHSEIKAQAECAFAQGHGFGVDYASPSDRAWIEGYAHALATQPQPQEAAPSQDAEDAARLDWIERNARYDPKMDGNHVYWPMNFNECIRGPSLRAAIDAARIVAMGKPEAKEGTA